MNAASGFSALFVGRGDETQITHLHQRPDQRVSVPSSLGGVMRQALEDDGVKAHVVSVPSSLGGVMRRRSSEPLRSPPAVSVPSSLGGVMRRFAENWRIRIPGFQCPLRWAG